MHKFADRMKRNAFLLANQYLDSRKNFLYEILSLLEDH